MAADFYRMTAPTEWAGPPEIFSHSTLVAIERCPRQWQLEHSRYGDLDYLPGRPTPAAVEGEIVHRTLEKLFRYLSQRGLPPLGTPEFSSCVVAFDLPARVRSFVTEHEEQLVRHPRGAAFRLRATNQDLVNRAVRLFRAQYAAAWIRHSDAGLPAPSADDRGLTTDDGRSALEELVDRGVLSEQKLQHPSLPLLGIVDLVWRTEEGTHVADFKTGVPSDEHRRQVLCYGVLWWRATGDRPAALEIRYPDEVMGVSASRKDLEEAERELSSRIAFAREVLSRKPAPAHLGESCRYCDARPFCEAYWGQFLEHCRTPETRGGKTTAVDLEVTVESDPCEHGFEAATLDGRSTSIVSDPDLLRVLGAFSRGDRIRIIGATSRNAGRDVELHRWTEVFHVA